jgi:hypothetical protein
MKSTTAILVFACLIVLSACNSGKIEKLTAQNDSLRLELKQAQSILNNFAAVTASLDSLEGIRKVVSSKVNGKSAHEVMASKIYAINEHVLATDKAIKSLDHQLKSSRYENSAYVMMMDAVKSELQIRVSEVSVLEGNIADVEQHNEEITLEKEKTVSELLSKVNEKQLALASLEDRLHRMESNFRNAEAEAVYARAIAVEESARKTRLAPAKKKEALNEALELYKKAKALGKVEADLNIQALQKTESTRSVASNARTL